jgi:ribonucleoside-diphosphate reductase alpha chain
MKKKARCEVMVGTTVKVELMCGNLYVTINYDEENKPFEVFLQLGKAGGCGYSQLEALARMISLAFRSGVSAEEVVSQLRGIRCPTVSYSSGKRYLSCADAVAMVLQDRCVIAKKQEYKPAHGQ